MSELTSWTNGHWRDGSDLVQPADGYTWGMGQAELLIAGLLVAVAGLSALARHLSVPYPIVLVIGGALFGFVPGLPEVKLDPEVVLGAQREALLRMRSDGKLSNEVMNRILRELDLEESRLEI